jgi:CBS domain-containing protein
MTKEVRRDDRVEDCMNPHVVTVPASATLDQAAQAMVERRVGSAVIMDGNDLVGIITERDVLRAVGRSLIPWTTPVSECMTSDPRTIPPDTTAGAALSLMLSHNFRHLPVVNDGTLLGIVSLRALAERMRESDRTEGTPADG